MTNDIVARLRQTHPVHCKCFGCEAAEEIALLRSQRDEIIKERDETRRELCNRCYGRLNARGAANLRGWDCFEETP
jgi:hypothetical protein